MDSPLINEFIGQLTEIQEGRPWVGSTFSRRLKGLSEDQFFIRPIEGMHSIAELISHLTLWRKEAILKIETGRGGKTDECEDNWLCNSRLRHKGWTNIKGEYDQTLVRLIGLLRQKSDGFLEEEYYDPDFKGYTPDDSKPKISTWPFRACRRLNFSP